MIKELLESEYKSKSKQHNFNKASVLVNFSQIEDSDKIKEEKKQNRYDEESENSELTLGSEEEGQSSKIA